jgi:hypothetical protein
MRGIYVFCLSSFMSCLLSNMHKKIIILLLDALSLGSNLIDTIAALM